MEAVLKFTVTNQEIARTDDFAIVEGSDNYLRAQFTFETPDWDGLVKSGVFIDEDGEAHTSLCTDDICDVPVSWLKAQRGAVGVLGSDGTTKITTSAARVRIREKGYTGDGGLEEEAEGYFDQIMEAFVQTRKETTETAGRAEGAEKSAEGWAHGHEDFPERAEDNAMYYADRARGAAEDAAASLAGAGKSAEDAEAAAMLASADRKETAALKAQAQTAAENALLSEQASEKSKAAAAQSAAAAEAAEGQAELSAQQTEESRNATEQAKAVVMQTGEEVAEDRAAVRQMADNFKLLRQQAVADVNNAGQTQTERVEEAGTQAVEDTSTAKTQALSEVQAAGAAQVSAVQTAGSAQVSFIQMEGDTQTERVQAAAAEIAADREQVSENRSGIRSLQEELAVSAPGIIQSASGADVVLKDSAEKPFKHLGIYGRSTQKTTAGAQLWDPENSQDGYIDTAGNIRSTGNPEQNEQYNNYIDVSGVSHIVYSMRAAAENHSLWLGIGCYDADMTFMRRLVYQSGENESTASGGWDLQEGIRYIRISYRKYSDVALSVCKGNAIIDEPYTGGRPSPNPEYPQEIVSAGDKGNINVDVTGKNLIPFPYVDGNRVINGVTITVNDDGTLLYNGTASSAVNIVLFKGKMMLKTGVSYAMSGNHAYARLNGIAGSDMTGGIPYTAKEGDYISQIWVWFASGTVFDNVLIEPQLETGTMGTAYEPPRAPQTLTLSTPNGLPGIPVTSGGNYTDGNGQQWVCDEVDFGRGVYVQRVCSTVLDNSKNWAASSGRFYTDLHDADKTPGRKVFCDAYTGMQDINLQNNQIGLYQDRSERYPGQNRIYVKDDSVQNADEMKEKLKDNPITVQYILAQPIENPLSAEDLAAYRTFHTNYPTTVIGNDAGAWMSVRYVADTENYIAQNYVPKESYSALEQRVAALEQNTLNNI